MYTIHPVLGVFKYYLYLNIKFGKKVFELSIQILYTIHPVLGVFKYYLYLNIKFGKKVFELSI